MMRLFNRSNQAGTARRYRGILPPWRVRGWLLVALPFSLFVSFLISNGPILQFYTSSVLYSRAPSIYASAHQDAVVRFVEPIQWISLAFHPGFLTVSIIAVIIMFKAKTLRGAALLLGMSIYLLITLIDISDAVINGSRAEAPLAASLAANLAGAVLVALVVFILLCVHDRIGRESLSKRGVLYAFPVICVLSGLSISAFLYFFLYFFYQPTPSRFEAVFSAPASAQYTSAVRGDTQPSSAEAQSFSIIPPGTIGEHLEHLALSGTASLEWSAPQGGGTYIVEVSLLQDCITSHAFSTFRRRPVMLRKAGVRRLRINVDEGTSDLKIGTEGANPTFAIRARRGSAFRLLPPRGESQILETDIRQGDIISMSSTAPIYLNLNSFVDLSRAPARPQPRTIELSIDGVSSFIAAGNEPRGARERGFDCRVVPPGSYQFAARRDDAIRTLQQPLSSAESIGVAVRLWRDHTDSQSRLDAFGDVVVSGGVGSAAVAGVSFADAAERPLGRAEAMSFGGQVTYAAVDGNQLSFRPHERFVLRGIIYGVMEESGGVRIRAEADQLWKDAVRLNQTRWERLSAEMQAAFIVAIAGLASLLIGAFRKTLSRLARDEPLRFYN
ncbi:MAG TPA: hypothetical protein VF702_07980 [Allosphingosinicella sp.]